MSRDDDQPGDVTVIVSAADAAEDAAVEPAWLEQLAETERRIAALEKKIAGSRPAAAAAKPTKAPKAETASPIVAATPEIDKGVTRATPGEQAAAEASEILVTAHQEAAAVLSEARREAFRLVTEARDDAENTAAEAQTNAARITKNAEETRGATRRDSIALIDEVKDESERLIAERNTVLETMRAEYETENADLLERITELRSIAADLENRLSAALQHHATQDQSPSPSPAPQPEPRPPTASGPAEDVAGSAQADPDTPNVPVQHNGVAPTAASRGSYYSRRSARLPRLGSDAGRNAIAAINAMRAHARDAENKDNGDGPAADKEGLTAQTA